MRLSLYRKLSTDKKLQRIRHKIKLVQLDLMTGIHSRTVNTGYKKLFTYMFYYHTYLHVLQEITQIRVRYTAVRKLHPKVLQCSAGKTAVKHF